MALIVTVGVPALANDDGVVFTFLINDNDGNTWECGFFHQPIHAPEPANGTVTPPVSWTEFDNLESWVETLKYAARNGKTVRVVFDNEIKYEYQSWSVSTPQGSYGSEFAFQQVQGVSG